MKKLFIGLLALGTISAFAENSVTPEKYLEEMRGWTSTFGPAYFVKGTGLTNIGDYQCLTLEVVKNTDENPVDIQNGNHVVEKIRLCDAPLEYVLKDFSGNPRTSPRLQDVAKFLQANPPKNY